MLTPAAWEPPVLTVLLVASAYLFGSRLGGVLGRIWTAKPDADWQGSPWRRRILRFAGEVVFQRKVIRHRPWAGLAHAVVFWGFCAFAPITLDHLAAGYGASLLPRASGFWRIYLAGVGVLAGAVAVAIAGLAVRRFLIRPRWLGERVSLESGVIALLIFTLMVTYLADYLGHGGRLNWWLHTLALLVFLPVAPRTKHLHLLVSPFAVLAGRGGFSRIPPLAGDDDFGLVAGRDVTRLVALEAYACVECGRCTEHCPAHNTGKELNPKEIVLGVRAYLEELGPRAEQPLLDRHVSREAAFQCTTCGACEYQCPVGIEHLPVIVGLRRGAVNTGEWDDDHGNRLFLNLERHGNPLGMAPGERDKFIARAGLGLYDGSQEYCLWLGCMGAYDPQGRAAVEALAAVLRRVGVSFGVLKRERCTGDAARRLGNDLVFAQLAEWNLEQLRAAGVRKMLSICPHCVRTIGEDWKEFGEAPLIEHHSEWLARVRDRLPGSGGGGRKVVFHDPCYLGRYRGVYGEPRTVASLGGALVEAPRARDRSFCCGAGGGLTFLGEEKGRRVSDERVRELAATGAAVIGVACPFCKSMLGSALEGLGGKAPRLADIAEIAAGNLPREVSL